MPDKLRREIEEILSRLDRFPPRRPLWWRLRDAVRRLWFGVKNIGTALPLPRFSLGQLMLLGAALIIIAWVFNPGSPSVTRIVIGTGMGLFLLAFILSLRRTSRRTSLPTEKRWRGQPMELHGPRVGHRLRSWWERWRSRR